MFMDVSEKRGNHCPAHNLAIENGSYEFQTGSSIKYDCKDGYMLYGAETLYCIQIAWNNRPPKCISKSSDHFTKTSS